MAGASRELVCHALLVTNRALRKWINRFNQCGVDGRIVKKRPGRTLMMKARWFNNYVCKNEEDLSERLDRAILDVIDNPNSTQNTAAIGTLF